MGKQPSENISYTLPKNGIIYVYEASKKKKEKKKERFLFKQSIHIMCPITHIRLLLFARMLRYVSKMRYQMESLSKNSENFCRKL